MAFENVGEECLGRGRIASLQFFERSPAVHRIVGFRDSLEQGSDCGSEPFVWQMLQASLTVKRIEFRWTIRRLPGDQLADDASDVAAPGRGGPNAVADVAGAKGAVRGLGGLHGLYGPAGLAHLQLFRTATLKLVGVPCDRRTISADSPSPRKCSLTRLRSAVQRGGQADESVLNRPTVAWTGFRSLIGGPACAASATAGSLPL